MTFNRNIVTFHVYLEQGFKYLSFGAVKAPFSARMHDPNKSQERVTWVCLCRFEGFVTAVR
jgi:hypothetical protein